MVEKFKNRARMVLSNEIGEESVEKGGSTVVAIVVVVALLGIGYGVYTLMTNAKGRVDSWNQVVNNDKFKNPDIPH